MTTMEIFTITVPNISPAWSMMMTKESSRYLKNWELPAAKINFTIRGVTFFLSIR